MAAVFEGLLSSRRRPARSRSEPSKNQLHTRWGDAAITAPQDGGWSQHYPEDDLNNPVYQVHDSPDSQKTLVNNSPDPGLDTRRVETDNAEENKAPAAPFIQKERSAITITIPLPWSRKSHRRSLSSNSHQVKVAQQGGHHVEAQQRPVLSNITTNVSEVIVAESRPTTNQSRAESPVVHTTTPVYDDISTPFTRANFPDKLYGSKVLPPLQTAVPPNNSQPASALSVLSPVAENFDGLSESNNVTPMDNTPVGDYIATALTRTTNAAIIVEGVAFGLEDDARNTLPSLPASRVTSPSETPQSGSERVGSRTSNRDISRSSSRAPGLEDGGSARTSPRGPSGQHRTGSRGAGEGRRSGSREPFNRRAGSAEPVDRRGVSRESGRRAASPVPARRRTLSRGAGRRRPDSPDPVARRGLSREPVMRRTNSPPATARRGLSQESANRRAESSESNGRRALSREPAVRRSDSPHVVTTRRGASREPAVSLPTSPRDTTCRAPSRDGFAGRADHSLAAGKMANHAIYPGPATRRAISREPYSRRRFSGDLAQRAASVEPVRQRASPREDHWVSSSRHGTPLLGQGAGSESVSDSSTSADAPASDEDEATEIETETDDNTYSESRKGWNGPAIAGHESRGFYAGVVQDYKAIAKDVEADIAQAGEPPGVGASLMNLVVNKRERETERVGEMYGGPDLVPSHEEMWG